MELQLKKHNFNKNYYKVKLLKKYYKKLKQNQMIKRLVKNLRLIMMKNIVIKINLFATIQAHKLNK